MTFKSMISFIFIATVLIIVCISYSNGQCLSDNDENQAPLPTNRLNLYRGQQAFTVSLLDAINKATPNENIFFSPYSTYHALLLAYFGAKNVTEAELTKALHLEWAPNKNHVMQAYRLESQLRIKRSKNSSVEFATADKIFLSKETELISCMKAFFNDELETLDFTKDAEKCRTDINEWVKQITKNQITDILLPGDITADTKIVLANAAYFKGQWASQFNPEDTQKEIFYSSSEKQVFVDMMNKKGTFNLGISERLQAHILELQYLGEGGSISMMILLPPLNSNGIENVLKKLTPETLEQALNDGMPREIEVKLPKFSFEKTIGLVPILKKLGISSLFSENSDLSGFSTKNNLPLGDARHKAKIQVDEEGSTAAAATVLFTFRSARPLDQATFYCNHPFIFLIYDRKSNAILFSGIYREPEN